MQRRSGLLLLLVASSLTIASLPLAQRLRVESDLTDLLPRGRPAADAYRAFLDAFGGLETVYVLVTAEPEVERGDERAADAAERLAELLADSELVAEARSGATAEDEEFLLREVLPRAALLVDDDRLERVVARFEPGALAERAAWIRTRLAGPLAMAEAPLLAADPLGLGEELRASAALGGLSYDPVLGAFVGRSRRTALVVATPAVSELDSRAGGLLLDILARSYAGVRKEMGGGLGFEAVGGPLYAARDEARIRRDVMRSVTASVVSIALLLVLYFGRPWLPAVLLVSVLAGVAWTAAAMALLRGRVSVIGVSFAAILVGLGVDYGIHTAHHFRAARLEGTGPSAAMRTAFRRTGPAILTSVATTALAFLVLCLASFRPVRELGLLVAVGIAAILLASVTLGAPMAVALAQRGLDRSPREGGLLWSAVGREVDRVVRASRRRRGPVLIAASVLTLLSLAGVSRLRVDADPRSLRPEHDPHAAVEEHLATEFAVGLDSFSVVLEGPDLAAALALAERTRRTLERTLTDSLTLWSPADYIVAGERYERRAEALRARLGPDAVDRLRATLSAEGLDPEAFSLGPLEAVLRGDPAAIAPAAWPSWISRSVQTTAGRVRVVVHATARVGSWPDGPPPAALELLEREVPEAAVASFPRVAAELRRTIATELVRLGAWCLLAVVLVVAVSYRGNLRRTLCALLPVTLGCLWLLGVCGGFGIPIGLLSVAAAPLVLGIGIDDGLHALHGERAHGGLVESVRSAGSAMTMTSLTTLAGFGSLTLSAVPAIRNGGMVVALGVSLCLLASLVLLPAVAGERRSEGGAR